MSIGIGVDITLNDRLSRGLSRVDSAFRKVSKSAEVAGAKFKKAGDAMTSIGTKLTAAFTLPVAALGAGALKAASDIETFQVAFESLTGSAEKAEEVLGKLLKFSEVTPFEPADVIKSAKTLAAFGISIDDVQDKLSFLGDIAAGTNVPLQDLSQIFGKIATKGKAQTEEILQLAERGVPIIQALAKQFGVNEQAIFDMAAAGKLDLATVENALRSLTAEGGIFAGQLEKQSKTIAGLFSTLKGRVFLALAEIGAEIKEAFNLGEVIPAIGDFIGKIVEGFKALDPSIKRMLVIGTALLAAFAPILAIVGTLVASIAAIVGTLVASIAAIVAGIAVAVPALIASAKIIAIIAGVMAIIAAVSAAVVSQWEIFKPFVMDIFASLQRIAQKFMPLILLFWEAIAPILKVIGGILAGVIVFWLQGALLIIETIVDVFVDMVRLAKNFADLLGLDIEMLDKAVAKFDELEAKRAEIEGGVTVNRGNELAQTNVNNQVNTNIEICQDETGKIKSVKAKSNDRSASVRVQQVGTTTPVRVFA